MLTVTLVVNFGTCMNKCKCCHSEAYIQPGEIRLEANNHKACVSVVGESSSRSGDSSGSK